jgi:hypothetical protein
MRGCGHPKSWIKQLDWVSQKMSSRGHHCSKGIFRLPMLEDIIPEIASGEVPVLIRIFPHSIEEGFHPVLCGSAVFLFPDPAANTKIIHPVKPPGCRASAV